MASRLQQADEHVGREVHEIDQGQVGDQESRSLSDVEPVVFSQWDSPEMGEDGLAQMGDDVVCGWPPHGCEADANQPPYDEDREQDQPVAPPHVGSDLTRQDFQQGEESHHQGRTRQHAVSYDPHQPLSPQRAALLTEQMEPLPDWFHVLQTHHSGVFPGCGGVVARFQRAS